MALFPDNMPAWLAGGLLGPIVGSLPAAQQEPDFLGGVGQGIANNPATLMALGAGIMNNGFAGGLQGALAGSQIDQRNRTTQQSQIATFQALKARGLSDADALAAIRNPEMLKALMPTAIPEYKPFSQGQSYGAFNPATGATSIQGNTPTFQTLSPGQTGGFATPPAPGARPPVANNDPTMSIPPSQVAAANASPGFQPVATGGPEKPPPGYDYVDPRDPSKGLKVTPGGPATQLPGDVAGRLAMIEAARPALAEAKKYFTDPNGLFSGAGSFIGQAIGQRTSSFEIGRQRRNVRYAVETALRVATGAAAPDSEVKNYADLYTPGVYDSLATRKQKIEALERFVSYAERNMGAGRMPAADTFMRPGTDKTQDRVPDPPAGFVRR